MKRKKFMLPVLALTTSVFLTSISGCRKDTKERDTSSTSEETPYIENTTNDDISDAGEPSGSTEGTTTDQNASDSPSLPDDAVRRGVVQSLIKENSIAISIRQNGKYYQESSSVLSTTFLYYFEAYSISRQFFNEVVSEADSKMTYEEFVQKMFESKSADPSHFDENYDLKKLPDDRVLFSIEARIDSSVDRTTAEFEQQMQKAFDRGMEIFFSDPTCSEYIKNSVNGDKLDLHAPIFYTISINMPASGCTYIDLNATALDDSGRFSMSECLQGEEKLSQQRSNRTMTIVYKTSNVTQLIASVPEEDEAEELIKELRSIRNISEVTSSSVSGWSKITPHSDYSGRFPECIFRIDMHTLDDSLIGYLGDNKWFYKSSLCDSEYLTIRDEKENTRLLNRLYDYVAIFMIQHHDITAQNLKCNWKPDYSDTYDVSRILKSMDEPNLCSAIIYNSDLSYRHFFYEADQTGFSYQEGLYTLQIASDGTLPSIYEDQEYYDYIQVGKEAYCRNNTGITYSPAEKFEGSKEPFFFLQKLSNDFTFVSGCAVNVKPSVVTGTTQDAMKGYTCETFQSKTDDTTFKLLLNSDGKIVAGWEFSPSDFTIYLSIIEEHAEALDLKDLIKQAREYAQG